MYRNTTPAPFTRDFGVRRVRSLTLASTIAGTAALAGFGLLAAVTNPGQQSTAAAGQARTTTAGTSTSQSAASSTPSTSSGLQPAAEAPTGAAGGAQTTTGGS